MKIVLVLPSDLKSIPREELDIINKYAQDPQEIKEILLFQSYVEDLAKRKVNHSFITQRKSCDCPYCGKKIND